MPNKKEKKVSIGGGIIVALLVLAFIMLSANMVVTYENQYNVIKQFGEVKTILAEPGFVLKMPLMQNVETYPKSDQFYDIPLSTVTTSDKKQMIIDAVIIWRITDIDKFLTSLRGNMRQAETRLSTIAYEKMKAAISAATQAEVISGRDKLANQIFASIGTEPANYGLEIVRLETKRLDLPDDNKIAVYSRMVAERESIAAQYLSEGERAAKEIRNETDRDISILLSQAETKSAEAIARGEKAYMEKMAEAYSTPERAEFYKYLRALQGLETSLQNARNPKLVLGSESPLVDVLYDK